MPGGSKKGGGLKVKSAYKSYTPYKMKAAAHNNSPIEKNYGSPAQRGFDFTGGVGSKEMEGGVGSAFDFASPAKGWLSNMAKKIGGAAKGISGGIGSLMGSIKEKMAAKKEAAAAAAAGPAAGLADAAGAAQAAVGGGGGGGADHTHPEFAQLDEAAQGGGGMQQQSVNPAKQEMMGGAGGGMWGGIAKRSMQAGMPYKKKK